MSLAPFLWYTYFAAYLFCESVFYNVDEFKKINTLLTATLQETGSIHDSINIPKIEFISYFSLFLYFVGGCVWFLSLVCYAVRGDLTYIAIISLRESKLVS